MTVNQKEEQDKTESADNIEEGFSLPVFNLPDSTAVTLARRYSAIKERRKTVDLMKLKSKKSSETSPKQQEKQVSSWLPIKSSSLNYQIEALHSELT